jgi:hypothetical protein
MQRYLMVLCLITAVQAAATPTYAEALMIGDKGVIVATEQTSSALGVPACRSLDIWTQAVMAFRQDQKAAERIMYEGCAWLRGGDRVIVDDHSFLNSLTCIRLEGVAGACWWVQDGAIKKAETPK